MKTFSAILCFSIFSTITICPLMRSPLSHRYFDTALQNAGVPG